MPIHVYKHTDAGAPVLDRTHGSLIGVLDACLVDGFGAGPTATPAGWTKDYSGTNQAAYRMPVGISSGRYLRVDDNVNDGATGRYARIWGYESMTAVDTGLDRFPLQNPTVDGILWLKSIDPATSVPWWLISDGAVFWLFIRPDEDADRQYVYDGTYVCGFGDAVALNAGDAHATFFLGGYYMHTTQYNYYNGHGDISRNGSDSTYLTNDGTSGFIRTADGGNTFAPAETAAFGYPTYATSSTSEEVVTNQPGGRMIATQPFFFQNGYRALIPGFLVGAVVDWGIENGQPYTFDGDPREFMAFRVHGDSSSEYRLNLFLDLTGPWR